MIDWVWVAVLAIPAYFLQTFVHEGAHALVGILQGLSIKSFKFWPHYVDHDNNPSTREWFFWGRVTYQDAESTQGERVIRALAPFIFNCWLAACAALLAIKLGGLHTVLLVYLTALSIDLCRGFMSAWWSSSGDFNKAAYLLGVSKTVRRLFATGMTLLVLANLTGAIALTILA